MKTYASGLGIVLLVGGLAVACTESDTGRVGERPSDRRPSASPPMTPPDTPGRSPAAPDKTETPPPVVTPPAAVTPPPGSGGSK